jgi:hypothetical protein
VQRATWNAVAAEHERLCSDRIAAAEKAARLKALEEAIRVVAEEHLDGFWEPVRDHADEAYDKAIDHAYDAISALITAAEAQPGAKT